MTPTTDVENDRQARIDVIYRYWNALMAGDMETFRTLLAPDAVIHYPGQNHMSGDYTTTDDIVDLYRRLSQFALDGVFTGEVLDVVVGEVYTAVVIRYDLHLPVKTLKGRAVGLFILDDDHRITEYWLHEWNQMMINWVFRTSRVFAPVSAFLTRRRSA